LISEDELKDLDPRFLSFLNINTPPDLEFARKLLAGRRESLDARVVEILILRPCERLTHPIPIAFEG